MQGQSIENTTSAHRVQNTIQAVNVLDPLAQDLVQNGKLTARAALAAQATARHRGLALADVLVIKEGIAQRAVLDALARLHNCSIEDPTTTLPDPRLMQDYGLEQAMRDRLIPWRKIGDEVLILVIDPDDYEDRLVRLTAIFGKVRMALTAQDQFDQAISKTFGLSLIARAQERTPQHLSCRNFDAGKAVRIGGVVCGALLCVAVLQPQLTFAVLVAIAVVFLITNSALRVAALVAYRRNRTPPDIPQSDHLPKITMLIPLHDETAIAEHLLLRLHAIDYPQELLDLCLVLEASDQTTRDAIGQAMMPAGMRTIVVPDGALKTKPRALNYALGFAHGSIIGIYDAEDAPEPSQLRKVADHFAAAPPDVVCLQGTLDYYNAESNWLTRCFTMEYASWFRVMLPGLAKMGFVVPLGGTTLFFKRDVLESLGAWDAHNVTEDADLGVRLARFGYRTEFVDTVTFEEANGRLWPWVKQRSRWLKGYAITYGVHMRQPVRLLRDLGLFRFLGVQMLFAGTLIPFLLAPVLLSFWLIPFGFAHPLKSIVPTQMIWTLGALFFVSELLNIAIATIAVQRAQKPWLVKWTPTLQFYFPLATIAAYRGVLELAWKPFYWDKTAHGVFKSAQPPPPPRPVSIGSRKPR